MAVFCSWFLRIQSKANNTGGPRLWPPVQQVAVSDQEPGPPPDRHLVWGSGDASPCGQGGFLPRFLRMDKALQRHVPPGCLVTSRLRAQYTGRQPPTETAFRATHTIPPPWSPDFRLVTSLESDEHCVPADCDSYDRVPRWGRDPSSRRSRGTCCCRVGAPGGCGGLGGAARVGFRFAGWKDGKRRTGLCPVTRLLHL